MRTLARSALPLALVLFVWPASVGAATRRPNAPSAPPRKADGPILAASDANDLAQNLNDAMSTQGVCYGWDITVHDYGSGPSGTEAGSSIDPSNGLGPNDCKKYVILTGSVTYQSDSSESNDTASWGIDSNLPNPPTTKDLKNLGVGGDKLLNDNNDTALINMVQALPLIVASKGQAPPVAADVTPKPASSPDHPTGKPGPDWLRQNLALFIVALVVLGVGLYWAIHQLIGMRRDRRHYKHGEAVHEVLADHVPEGAAHSPAPSEHKPSEVVQNWVAHVEGGGAELTPEHKAHLLQTIELAKNSGSLNLTSAQLKRIRKTLGAPDAEKPDEQGAAEQPAAASAPEQPPPSPQPPSSEPPKQ